MENTDENFLWPPKNMGGRPRHFSSAKKLNEKIEEYFATGITKKTHIIGSKPYQKEVEVATPTITGLALYLGFASRQSFYDYEKSGKFSYVVKKARLRIEVNYEEMLQLSTGLVSGPIFALKNMGWTDKTEVNHGGVQGGPPIMINLGYGTNPDADETTE